MHKVIEKLKDKNKLKITCFVEYHMIMALPDEAIMTDTVVAVEDLAGLVVVQTSNAGNNSIDNEFNLVRCFNSDDEDTDHQVYMIKANESIVAQADVPVGTPAGNFPLIQDYLSSLSHSSEVHISRPTIQMQKKRYRDRLRKRELRLNDNYKEKDRIGARMRMKKRRKDPIYRSIERERDRTRRQKARQLLKLAKSKNETITVETNEINGDNGKNTQIDTQT